MLVLGPVQMVWSGWWTPAPSAELRCETEICLIAGPDAPAEDGPAALPPRHVLVTREPTSEVKSSATSFIALLYLGGALLMAGYQALGWARTRRLLRYCQPVDNPEVFELWTQVAAASRRCGRVRLLSCEGLRVPCCGGLFHPYLVIPERDLYSTDTERLAWALRHEQVHLERGDAGMALVRGLALVVFWFHPAVWWLARQLTWWCEASCDRQVVRRWGRAKSYALALLHYAQRHLSVPIPLSTGMCHAVVGSAQPGRWPPWRDSRSQLRRRVEALAGARAPRSSLRRLGQEIGVLVLLLVLGAGQVALAATFAPRSLLEPGTLAPAWSARDGFRFVWHKDGSDIEIQTEGAVRYDASSPDLVSLPPGSSMLVRQAQASRERRLEIIRDELGHRRYDYRVNGTPRPFEAENQTWLAEVLRTAARDKPIAVALGLERPGG
jgi:beta-lactamase regulating signal transducer with metallopeptidase domain